ncbi:hypothetical protein SAMN04488082_1056 [Desulfomicrobium apsheronum]|uniref:Uncharacterized protein n=1 Tax=Desulfomicrobium apsheronum TaxID=52560 RepID=A0A1I3SXC9_9BACT|nr:hypothetical protein SAMN04488082_1056 [Desulfomicrobium apsheronum]
MEIFAILGPPSEAIKMFFVVKAFFVDLISTISRSLNLMFEIRNNEV